MSSCPLAPYWSNLLGGRGGGELKELGNKIAKNNVHFYILQSFEIHGIIDIVNNYNSKSMNR